VILGCAEDQRLLILIDLLHENLHAVRLTFFDLDDLVEVSSVYRFPDSISPSINLSSDV
jgi:hypothetical protein